MWKAVAVIRKYIVPGVLFLALAFSVFEGIRLSLKVDALEWRLSTQEREDVGDGGLDDQLRDFRMNNLRANLIMSNIVSDNFVNIANQYRINESTTCSDIEMRLGDTYSNFTLLSDSIGEEAREENFKRYTDGIIEANENSDYIVRTWERIEYCLLNQ